MKIIKKKLQQMFYLLYLLHKEDLLFKNKNLILINIIFYFVIGLSG